MQAQNQVNIDQVTEEVKVQIFETRTSEEFKVPADSGAAISDKNQDFDGDYSQATTETVGVLNSIENLSSWHSKPQKDSVNSQAAKPTEPLIAAKSTSQQQTQQKKLFCNCPKSSEHPQFCTSALRWYQLSNPLNKNFCANLKSSYKKLKLEYKGLATQAPKSNALTQIEKDVNRTLPRIAYFNSHKGGKGQLKLRRVLIAFSNYRGDICYVQGMNYIVAQLLLHCSETFTFWLFVALIEDYDLQDIYGNNLNGHFMHSAIIEILVKANLPELDRVMETNNLQASIFASEWIFGLFTSVIPPEFMKTFFDSFFEKGWIFFYQLVLTLLKRHQNEITNEEELFLLLKQIKTSGQHSMIEPQPLSGTQQESANLDSQQIDQSTSSQTDESTKMQDNAPQNSDSHSQQIVIEFLSNFWWSGNTKNCHNTVAIADPEYWPTLLKVSQLSSDKFRILHFVSYQTNKFFAGSKIFVLIAELKQSNFFVPQQMSKTQWPKIQLQRAAIERLAINFNLKSQSFGIELPHEHKALNRFLTEMSEQYS